MSFNYYVGRSRDGRTDHISRAGANAAGLLSKPDIDGGLIGGASLKAEFISGIAAVAPKP